MKIWKRIVVYSLLAVVLVIGAGFPSIVGAIQDVQIGRMRDQVEAKTVQLEMSSNLSVIQKLMVVQEGAASAVELESAQKMEYQEAYQAASKDLKILLSGFAPFRKSEFAEKDHSIELRMYEENSVILWRFVLVDKDENQIQVLLDDDSGKILAFQYLKNVPSQSDESISDSNKSVSTSYDVNTVSLYDEIDDVSVTAEEYVFIFAEYLDIWTGGIDYMKKYGNYYALMYDATTEGAFRMNITLTDTEFSVNF